MDAATPFDAGYPWATSCPDAGSMCCGPGVSSAGVVSHGRLNNGDRTIELTLNAESNWQRIPVAYVTEIQTCACATGGIPNYCDPNGDSTTRAVYPVRILMDRLRVVPNGLQTFDGDIQSFLDAHPSIFIARVTLQYFNECKQSATLTVDALPLPDSLEPYCEARFGYPRCN